MNRARFRDFVLLFVKLGGDHFLCLRFLHGEARRFAPFAAQSDLLAQNFQQLRIRPRLFHEIGDAALHCFDGNADRGPSGHNHNRRHALHRLQPRQQIQSLAAGSGVARVIQVHQQEIEFAALERLQQIRRRGSRFGGIAVAFQQQAQGPQHVGLIVGNQNSRLHGSHFNGSLGHRC